MPRPPCPGGEVATASSHRVVFVLVVRCRRLGLGIVKRGRMGGGMCRSRIWSRRWHRRDDSAFAFPPTSPHPLRWCATGGGWGGQPSSNAGRGGRTQVDVVPGRRTVPSCGGHRRILHQAETIPSPSCTMGNVIGEVFQLGHSKLVRLWNKNVCFREGINNILTK